MTLGRLFFGMVLCLFSIASEATSNVYGPPDHDGPIVVDIGFFLTNINDISEETETFEFEGILHMRWNDPRLSFDPEQTGFDERYYQGAFQFNEVFSGWWPQVYLANEAGRFDRQGVILRIAPDGTVEYSEEINAVAKSRLALRRFPFDEQEFTATFEVLGMDTQQVLLQVDSGSSGIWQDEHHEVSVPQWYEPQLALEVVEYDPRFTDGRDDPVSAFKVKVKMERNPWHMLRLVVFPVMIFVFLSWSVFWMDRSSVGDRMDISFIGILTVVAYQIMFSESLPKISYTTILMSFMIISFLMMCAIVLINLRVAALDKSGRSPAGDQVDRQCRWIFPLVYFLSIVLVGGYIYVVS